MKKCTAIIVLAFCLCAFAGCTHKTKIAHGRLFHDDTFNFEALRALHYAPTEGADINEVLDTVAEIRENDFDSWTDEWTKRARMTEARGDRATDDLSKARCYARASNYYRTAEFFIDHSDPRKAELGRKSQQLFTDISICEKSHMSAWKYPGRAKVFLRITTKAPVPTETTD